MLKFKVLPLSNISHIENMIECESDIFSCNNNMEFSDVKEGVM